MTAGRRLLNFAFVWLAAVAVWVVARWLWPYLELGAPLGALVVLLFAVNIIDGV
jgi:predicted anti-sigma-YlaC factor YlaD